MTEKSKFTKREWIHLIITLSIVQGFVWWVSFQFAGNSSALGYVSFAGTLISIILAVLAIGYTYGESQQQKSSSTTLANQIESLVVIKDKLEIQAEALGEIKNLKSEITRFSENFDQQFTATNSRLNSFTEKFHIIDQHRSNPSAVVVNSTIDDEEKEKIFNKMFIENEFLFHATTLILVVAFFEKRRKYEDLPFSIQFFNEIDELELDEGSKSLLAGSAFQLSLMLERFQLLRRDLNTLDDIVINYFNKIINENFDELKPEFNGQTENILKKAKESIYYKKEK